MKKRIVVVLGMHRSGTSALSNSLVQLGAYPGRNLMPEDSANPKGYWEDINLVALNDAILRRFDLSWKSIDNPLLNRCENFLSILEEQYMARALHILSEHLQVADTILIKDPRISVLLPFWKLVFERLGVEVKYVLALRHPLDSAQSLLKRDLMNLEYGVKLWAYYTLMTIAELNAPLMITSYDSLLENPTEQLSRLALLVGSEDKKWDKIEFLDAKLRHHQQDGQELERLFGKDNIIEQMYQSLLNAANKYAFMSVDELRKLALRFINPIVTEFDYLGSENVGNYAQVFIDSGKGFSEQESKKIYLQGKYSCEISVLQQERVEYIRLDPSFYSCVAIVHQAEFKYEEYVLPYQITGGNFQVSIDNRVFIFENDDPQIFFRLNGQSVSEVAFRISVFPLDVFACSLINSMSKKQLEELNNSTSELKRERVELVEQVRLYGSKIEELNIASSERQLILNKTTHELNQTTHELNQTKHELNKTTHELNQTKQELDKTAYELNKTTHELNQTAYELNQTKHELNKTTHELNQTTHVLDSTKLELETWKQTARDYKLNVEAERLKVEAFIRNLNERKIAHSGLKQSLSRLFKRFIDSVKQPRQSWSVASDKSKLKPIFDEFYYLYHNQELIHAPFDLLEHFAVQGWKEGRSPNSQVHMWNLLKDNPHTLGNPLLVKKNKTIKEVIVHIGLHKTGTSSIQHSLFSEENNKLLESNGIIYPRSIGENHSESFYSLFTEYPEYYQMNIKKGLSKEEIHATNQTYVQSLLNELSQRKGDKLVISGEDISKLSAHEVLNLQQFLYKLFSPNLKIRVVVYVRHPMRWAISSYQEMIKNGLTVNSAWDEIENTLNGLFQACIQKFVNVFGTENVSVRSFEQALNHPKGIVGHFLSELGMENHSLEGLSLIRSNEGLSMIAVDLISYLNARIPLILGGKHNPERNEQEILYLHTIRGQAFDIAPEYKDKMRTLTSVDIQWLIEQFSIDYSDTESKSISSAIVLTDEIVEEIHTISNIVSEPMKSVLLEYITEKLSDRKSQV